MNTFPCNAATKFICLLCFFLSARTLPAQAALEAPTPVLFYLNLGGALPSQTGFFGADMIFNESWSAGISVANSSRNSANTPADYHSNFTIFLSSYTVKEKLRSWNFTAGKVWHFSPQSRARFHLKAGLGFEQFRSPVNFVKSDVPFFENYSYTWDEQTTVGFILQPTLEVPVNRFFGFSLGFNANLNKYWKAYGLSLAINPGYFSGRRAPHR